MFTCVCGKSFEKIQSLNAHKTHCKEFLGEDRYNELKEKHIANIEKASIESKKKHDEKKQKELEQWIKGLHTCENCGKIMEEKYGSGRFCSAFCARSFVSKNQSEESIKKKVEAGAANLEKGREYMKSIAKPKKEKSQNSSKERKTNIIKETKYCSRCGKEISNHNNNGYCLDCYRIMYRKNNIETWLDNGDFSWSTNKLKIPSYIKEYILKDQNNKCAICGCDTVWNGQHLVFVCDHIDGDASKNNRENLRCICPNCDSQLPTFKSKNKNSKRTWRKTTKSEEKIQ